MNLIMSEYLTYKKTDNFIRFPARYWILRPPFGSSRVNKIHKLLLWYTLSYLTES